MLGSHCREFLQNDLRSPGLHRVAWAALYFAGGLYVANEFGHSSFGVAVALAEAPASSSFSLPDSETSSSDPYVLPPPGKGLPKRITLYQYEVCPFCCKVKAFLDYNRIPYRVVEVNPLTKGELKWSEYKKVPVVVLDDIEQVNDSSVIISRLASELEAERKPGAEKERSQGGWWSIGLGGRKPSSSKAYGSGDPSPQGRAMREEEAAWRRWVDEKFVKVITVNIYRNAKESFQTFDYITEHGNFGWVQRQAARVVGATMMWSLSNRLKKKYNVEGDVREALYQCAEEWIDAVGPNRPFMGGKTPNLADLAVFGVIRSVVGTDTFMDLQHNTAIGPWYERMMSAVAESSRIE